MTRTGRCNDDSKRGLMMPHAPTPHVEGPRASHFVLVAGALALLLGATAQAAPPPDQAMVLDAGSTQFYRQQAVDGRKKHDFSPRTPPRRGNFIYGHWTPYEPPDPTTYPPGSKTHVIVRGDTLSALAGKYYKDSLLWPFIWDANSWVTYPHWIYPGDTLLIPSLMVMPEGRLEEVAQLPSITEAFYAPTGPDFYNCGHFIVDPGMEFAGEIVATEADPAPVMVTKDDVVYINVGSRDGALPGDEFAVLYPRTRFEYNAAEVDHQFHDDVRHPITGEKLGMAAKMAGRLKIILLGEIVSTARIVYACDAMEVGYELYPFTELPMPLVRRKDREKYFNEMAADGRGYVVWLADEASTGSPIHLFTIDLGRKQGLVPGDVFTIFRDVPSNFANRIEVEHLGRAWDYRNARRQAKERRSHGSKSVYGKQEPVYEIPPHVVGRCVVLYTQENTATARVIEANSEFWIGDQVVYEGVDEGEFRVPEMHGNLTPGLPLSRQPPPMPASLPATLPRTGQ